MIDSPLGIYEFSPPTKKNTVTIIPHQIGRSHHEVFKTAARCSHMKFKSERQLCGNGSDTIAVHFSQLCVVNEFLMCELLACHNEAFGHKFIIIYGGWNSHVLLCCCRATSVGWNVMKREWLIWPEWNAKISGIALISHVLPGHIKCKCLRANHPHKTWVFILSKPRIHKCAYTYFDCIMNMHIKLYAIRERMWVRLPRRAAERNRLHIECEVAEREGTNAHPNQFIVLRLYENDNISISQDNNPYNMFYGTYNNEKSFRTINKINIFIHLVTIS